MAMKEGTKRGIKYGILGLLGGAPAIGVEILSEKMLDSRRRELELSEDLSRIEREDDDEDEDL